MPFDSEVVELDSRAIPEEHLMNVCKQGQGEKMCRFAAYVSHKKVFYCWKNSDSVDKINHDVRTFQKHAVGDNCSGPPNFEPIVPN